jgi:hypothetical protein
MTLLFQLRTGVELALRDWPHTPHGHPPAGDREQEWLGDLVASAGRLLPAWPRLVWARWQDNQHRVAKRHGAFAALRQVPVGGTVTAGNGSEREPTRQVVLPGGLYVCDRGSGDYDLVAQWHAFPRRFIGCGQNPAAYVVADERALSAAARAAGVTRAVGLQRLGTAANAPCLAQSLRVVGVTPAHRHKDGPPLHWCWSPIA